MTDDYGNVQIYLGDGRATPQRDRLIDILSAFFVGSGWREVPCVGAERVISIGRAERWLTLFDSFQLDEPEEHGSLCVALSEHFPLVSLRWWAASSAEKAALGLALYRDGAALDQVGRGHAVADHGTAVSYPGRPVAWADLLGSRRNAARLESAWSGMGAAEEVLDSTAEIVGFDAQLCRRGQIDGQRADEEEVCARLDRQAIAGWTGFGFEHR